MYVLEAKYIIFEYCNFTLFLLFFLNQDALADRGVRAGAGDAAQVKRDKTRVVKYRVPHNAAVQIYDYKEKKAR